MIKLNSVGFSHYLLMAAVVVVFAVAGTLLLVISHANPATNPYSCPNQPTLRQGDTGTCVKRAQWFLKNYREHVLGQRLAITGTFDQPTVNATKQFQTYSRLSSTGIINANTWTQLNVCATSGICSPTPVSSVSTVSTPS